MAQYFPTIVFAIIALTILAGVIFSPVVESDLKPIVFAFTLVGLTTWLLLIYWYCVTDNVTFGWFFILFPFGITLMWYIAKWLHRASFRYEE